MKFIATIENFGSTNRFRQYVVSVRLKNKLLAEHLHYTLKKAKEWIEKKFPGAEIVENFIEETSPEQILAALEERK